MKRLVMCVVCGIVCGLFLLPAGVATATEMVWMPMNPSFGGPSYNATWLMASAQAQNTHIEKPEPYTYERPSPFDDFEYTLQRQYLSGLSRMIIDEAFGEEGLLPEGPGPFDYTVGEYDINIATNGSQITVKITDTVTGNVTSVSLPYF